MIEVNNPEIEYQRKCLHRVKNLLEMKDEEFGNNSQMVLKDEEINYEMNKFENEM